MRRSARSRASGQVASAPPTWSGSCASAANPSLPTPRSPTESPITTPTSVLTLTAPSSVDSADPSPSSAPAAGATFHTRVAEALGLYDGDNGSYIYADEERCLEEIAKNAREGELWRAHVRVLDEASDGLEEPEACGCEESDDLKARLRDIHTECELAIAVKKTYSAAISTIRELSKP